MKDSIPILKCLLLASVLASVTSMLIGDSPWFSIGVGVGIAQAIFVVKYKLTTSPALPETHPADKPSPTSPPQDHSL